MLYSEPDIYRFRIAVLPQNVMNSPHSEKSTPILLSTGQTGDLVKGNLVAYSLYYFEIYNSKYFSKSST